MNLAVAHQKLGWPDPKTILKPGGSGPAMFAKKVRMKIGLSLQRSYAQERFRIGILHADADGADSQPPLAVVCEFATVPVPNVLQEVHRLAWNFCHVPLLVTLEPGMIRVWDCGHEPKPPSDDLFVSEEAVLFSTKGDQLDDEALRLLHWVTLSTGQFLRERVPADKVKPEKRADRSLLENLRQVRAKLRELKLPVDVCHDLLARVIFVQFLWDRRDANGDAALSPEQLARWQQRGLLKGKHASIGSVLRHREDAYSLFKELDRIFNGDLFPGKEAASPAVRAAAWKREQRAVHKEHLDWLARLVDGQDDSKTGQFWLWRLYSFDTIPLEFISSIYEEFVTRDGDDEASHAEGVVYTPGRVTDYVLDQVLPWHGTAWRLRVLDPACGSGIFLVKAFQRLAYRWRNANRGHSPRAAVLRQLLERYLLGVDKNPHAVHVASFSLYLAMLDELEPKDYLERVRFPCLRDHRLIHSDFFADSWRRDFRPRNLRFDVIVGNAPWGDKTATPVSTAWAAKRKWPIADKNIGPLFLPAAADLLAVHGQVAMLQPAMTVLFNRAETANAFRRRFFSEFSVRKVVNFAPARFILFGNRAISPACLVVFDGQPLLGSAQDDDHQIEYSTVKPKQTSEDNYALMIEPFDIHLVSSKEAVGDPLVWTALAWGGRRDLSLLRSLAEFPSIAKMKSAKTLRTREGINRGDRKKTQRKILGWKILESKDLPTDSFPRLSTTGLPTNNDPLTDDRASTDFAAFERPQLIIKGSWKADESRFKASLVDFQKNTELGLLCSQSYITVSDPNAQGNESPALDAACLVLNSKLTVYCLLLTSSRFAAYRPEPLVADFLNIPLPPVQPKALDGVRKPTDCDALIRNAFELAKEDWALVEDLFDYTLPDFKGDATSAGRRCTTRKNEPQLSKYFDYLRVVLAEAFGQDKRINATVWQEPAGAELLGLRLMAIELGGPSAQADEVSIRTITTSELLTQIAQAQALETQRAQHSWLSGSVLRIYGSTRSGRTKTPTVFLVKPDQVRYWTRTMAMRDADEIAADLLTGLVPAP